MNAIMFGTKRAFLSGVRITRPSVQSVAHGLTAARFDMMYALTQWRRDRGKFHRVTVLQRELRRILDVCSPVVSRMLRSLEALGWVTRERPRYGDRRQRRVALTDAGLACFRRAYKLLYRVADSIVTRAICWRNHRDRGERLHQMGMLESFLRSLRGYYRDRARLDYWWGHPEDIHPRHAEADLRAFDAELGDVPVATQSVDDDGSQEWLINS
jgi:DNA-binding MarR family transcriptional regulator